MTAFIFANNVNTTLAGAVSNTATSITLASSANLPSSIPSGSVLVVTLNDVATRNNYEVVYATAISGATLTVQRAQESTAALSWLVGDFAFSGPTAGQQESFGQEGAANTWTGANTFTETVTAPTVNTGTIEAGASPLFLETDSHVSVVNSTNTAYAELYCAAPTIGDAAVNLDTGDARYVKHGSAALAGTQANIGWTPSTASSDVRSVTFTAPCNGVVISRSFVNSNAGQTASFTNYASINGVAGGAESIIGSSIVSTVQNVASGSSVTVSATATSNAGTTIPASHWLEYQFMPS
ncbi:hypothetical protein [Paraburkholderia acidisoli]|uniref:Uncharacterized protein n=1 Tax=Paraburkholderia acidisoli TaxID=2571748 RepID=A0A7Z2JIZ2_9BURK|nr:hypothetical protein [Paraburkholderia acidisoli]QGZ66261.1 hypothetical protein FAZ98_31150 [Paraburkholderia acidisoli]